jgi:DNA-binding transcriptional MerR regulator
VPEQPVLLDGPAVAAALGVKPGLVRQWANRQLIVRMGRDRRGRTLYALADAFRLQAELHARRRVPA